MSGTLSSIYNNSSFALYIHSKAMAALQEQAYTGSRINRASDDPSTAYRVLGLNSQNIGLGNYIDNISGVISTLTTSTKTITAMSSAVADTIAELTKLMSDTHNKTNRTALARQVNDTTEQTIYFDKTEK